MIEHEEGFQTSIQFEGRVSESDKILLSSLMGRMGLKFMIEDNPVPLPSEKAVDQQAELILQNGYKFSDITSPHHILLKEHFDDLVEYAPEYSKNTYTRAFSKLFDDAGAKETFLRWQPGIGHEQIREPMPMTGVTVIQRDSEKLGQFKGSTYDKHGYILASRYGIVAGSIVEAFGDRLDEPHRKSGPVVDKCAKEIADWLRFQFVTSNDLD